MRALRRFIPRFSLRTLAILLLLATSAMGLWWHWGEPWAEECVLDGAERAMHSAEFSDGDRTITTWNADGNRRVSDIATRAVLRQFKAPRKELPRCDVSRQVPSLQVEVLDDCTAVIRDFESGEALRVLKGHERPAYFVRFSPDGARVATASRDGTARIWDASSGECVSLLDTGGEAFILSVDFSPDGKRAVTGDSSGGVFIWDLADGEELTKLVWDWGAIWLDTYHVPLAFELFRRTGFDYTQCATFAAVVVGPEDEDDFMRLCSDGVVYSVRFSSDGERLVIASTEGAARIYRRRRPEWWWGVFWLWEFWLTGAFAALFVWSVWRDRRALARAAAPGALGKAG